MGISIIALLFLPLALFASVDEMKHHCLYLMQQNQISESIEKYREFSDHTGRSDFEILQQLSLTLLQNGIKSTDNQTFMMTLFGAGLSGSIEALDILEKGISHPDPQVQLLSLHFIAKIEDDRTIDIFTKAMNSEFLGIRMEAAFYMAQKKHPLAVGLIEGLMYRLPPVFKPYFPSLFALLGTNESTASLKRLIEDTDSQTRVESILNVAKLGRDDFLPLLRKRLTHTHIAELEATAFAVGQFKDSNSSTKLKKLTQSASDTVKIAAALALLQLGDRSYISLIEDLAKESNLFAISALGNISETEETLAELSLSKDLQVRINAAIALLQRRDSRCLKPLKEILLQDIRSLYFRPISSLGRTITAIKAVPSAELLPKDSMIDLNYSQAFREHLLQEAIHLKESDFLSLAKQIFFYGQNDLVPTTIALLENLQTDDAIALLNAGAQKVGSPLIRDYCHLSLYRLKQEGPHEDHVNHWVMNQKESELIQFKELLPWKLRMEQTDYNLSAEETSRLLIESILAIASRRDEKSISLLLEAIQHGNPYNRFALMGLLMKATE